MPIPCGAAAARTVILATGGTIAGTAADAADTVGYAAARLGVEALVAAVPALAGRALETEQVAQLDSKDMDEPTWRRLAERVAAHLARDEVAGVVVTHGTDTLEETAYFLQRVLAPAKPVVLTAAMRPATALQADGPQNLLDAVTLAAEPGAAGVVAVLAGTVHGAFDLRKLHTYRLDAFGSGDAGPLGVVEAGRLRRFRDWPRGTPIGLAALPDGAWPRVELVTSHAGASGALVDALVEQGVDGIVAAGTGNGTLHLALEAALRHAAQRGVLVRRSTRVAMGALLDGGDEGRALPASGASSAVQARVELLLELMQRPRGAA
jgi:L-asparaginase